MAQSIVEQFDERAGVISSIGDEELGWPYDLGDGFVNAAFIRWGQPYPGLTIRRRQVRLLH